MGGLLEEDFHLEGVVMVRLVEDPTVFLETAVQFLANSLQAQILHMGTVMEYLPTDFQCQSHPAL